MPVLENHNEDRPNERVKGGTEVGSSSEMSEETERLQGIIAPMSADEVNAAHEAVDRHLAEHSKRYRILGPELLIDKPPRPGQPSARTIRALVVDYDNTMNLEIVVQPSGEIIEAKTIDWQPSFAPEEVEEAREIAESDERVARFLAQPGLSVIAFGPGQPEGTNPRLIGLRYLATVDGRPRLIQAVVNLSTRQLADVEQEG